MFSANQIARFFNQPYLQNRSVRHSDFLCVNINSVKWKVDQKMVGCGQSGHRTLKLTVSQEQIDGIN